MRTLDPRDLYRPGTPPASGAHIDVNEHVARFPTDGSVLTTPTRPTPSRVATWC